MFNCVSLLLKMIFSIKSTMWIVSCNLIHCFQQGNQFRLGYVREKKWKVQGEGNIKEGVWWYYGTSEVFIQLMFNKIIMQVFSIIVGEPIGDICIQHNTSFKFTNFNHKILLIVFEGTKMMCKPHSLPLICMKDL